MGAALARAAGVLTAIVFAAGACGGDPAEPSPSPPPTSAAVSPSSSPSSAGPESQAEFCANLNAFAAAAGPTFELGTIALIDGETPNERAGVSRLVDAIALNGVLIKGELPTDLADDVDTVVGAATEAKTKLAKDVPASDAVAALKTDKVKAARDAVVAYRGSC
jgi:hypothetical protein